ncbi:hypothetical protein MRX96_052324 [Rhipicephalus microplus]
MDARYATTPRPTSTYVGVDFGCLLLLAQGLVFLNLHHRILKTDARRSLFWVLADSNGGQNEVGLPSAL